uniref:Uncharacterized protein n=1 Tax=Toxoplasma gondii TgCATBr9 TaxID=943120 RepID=A0A2T6ISU4_TOXGO|nr:hypothetical protein TGBR9_382360 [Toxoplasma gondii TgCATBr9]
MSPPPLRQRCPFALLPPPATTLHTCARGGGSWTRENVTAAQIQENSRSPDRTGSASASTVFSPVALCMRNRDATRYLEHLTEEKSRDCFSWMDLSFSSAHLTDCFTDDAYHTSHMDASCRCPLLPGERCISTQVETPEKLEVLSDTRWYEKAPRSKVLSARWI